MGFFDDPNMMALLGAAQGFGQAAMPTRVPTPLGAALGMGAGGAAQGAMQSQDYRIKAAQAQAAQMQNQFLQAMMPYKLQGARAGAALLGGGQGAPFGAPMVQPGSATGPVANASYGPPQPATGGGASGFLFGPQQMLGMSLLQGSLGNDRLGSTYAGMYGHTLEPGYMWDSSGTHAVPVPGGNVDPAVIARNQAAKTAAELATTNQLKPITVGPRTNPVTYPSADAAFGSGGAAGTPAAGAMDRSTIEPLLPYANRVAQYENQTGDPGAKNPASNATGDGQFLDSTWSGLFPRVFPNLAQGKSPQEILAYRNSPDMSRVMTAAYAADNAPKLMAAGFQPTDANLYLAHRLGPDGAIKVLNTTGPGGNPNTPIAAVLGTSVVQTNPDLRTSTGAFVQMARQRFGAGTSFSGTAPASAPAPGASAPAPAAVATPGLAVQRAAGGGISVQSTQVPQDAQYTADRKSVDEESENLGKIQTNQLLLLKRRALAASLPTGSNGALRTEIATWAATYLPKEAADAMAKLAGLGDNLNPAQAQEFAKYQLAASGLQEKEAVGARGSLGLTGLFMKMNPGLETLPDANRRILNLQLVQGQAEADYIQGLQHFVNQNGQAWMNRTANYVPSQKFDEQWQSQRNPQVYLAAINAMNGDKDWAKGLQSNEEFARAAQTVWRIDPTAPIVNPADGRLMTMPQAAQAAPPQQQAAAVPTAP